MKNNQHKAENVLANVNNHPLRSPRLCGEIINPAKYYVIPAVAKRRAGIQRNPRYYWIPAFAGKTV